MPSLRLLFGICDIIGCALLLGLTILSPVLIPLISIKYFHWKLGLYSIAFILVSVFLCCGSLSLQYERILKLIENVKSLLREQGRNVGENVPMVQLPRVYGNGPGLHDVGVQEPVRNAAVAVQEPVVNDAVQEPVVNDAVQEPVVNDAVQEPVLNDAVLEPVVNDAVQEPVVNDSVQEPVVNDAVQEPVVNDAVQEPVVNDAVQEHVVNDAVQEPVVNDAVQEPVVNDAVLEPVVNDAVLEPVVNGAVQEPVVNAAVAVNEPANNSDCLQPTEAAAVGNGMKDGNDLEIEAQQQNAGQNLNPGNFRSNEGSSVPAIRKIDEILKNDSNGSRPESTGSSGSFFDKLEIIDYENMDTSMLN